MAINLYVSFAFHQQLSNFAIIMTSAPATEALEEALKLEENESWQPDESSSTITTTTPFLLLPVEGEGDGSICDDDLFSFPSIEWPEFERSECIYPHLIGIDRRFQERGLVRCKSTPFHLSSLFHLSSVASHKCSLLGH